jgi:hypothetical protein
VNISRDGIYKGRIYYACKFLCLVLKMFLSHCTATIRSCYSVILFKFRGEVCFKKLGNLSLGIRIMAVLKLPEALASV